MQADAETAHAPSAAAMLATAPAEGQDKLLQEALHIVKAESFHMQRCLDKSKLMDALKHASTFLGELRTSMLSPKAYYELYMVAVDKLHFLESYLVEEFNKGRRVADLYELVQYAGNIIPRLYLLITVGSVYSQTGVVRVRAARSDDRCCRRPRCSPDRTDDGLADLLHRPGSEEGDSEGPGGDVPRRTAPAPWFIPAQLPAAVHEELPARCQQRSVRVLCRARWRMIWRVGADARWCGRALREADGTVKDSIDFILMNFGEMNKLWVRMQHQGHSRDRDRREKERQQLRVLVGTNLVRLSQLEGLDVHTYTNVRRTCAVVRLTTRLTCRVPGVRAGVQFVLTGVLEQVVSCKDAISQEYLMECVIHVFPDEFHLQTLQKLLGVCSSLQPTVNVKTIISALIDRLAAYVLREHAVLPEELQLFDIFSNEIASLLRSRPDMPLADMLALMDSLLNLAVNCYTDRRNYVDQVYGQVLDIFKQMNVTTYVVSAAAAAVPARAARGGVIGAALTAPGWRSVDKEGKAVTDELLKLLNIPIATYKNVLNVISLNHFATLFGFLSAAARRQMAQRMVQNVLANGTMIGTSESASALLDLISPLVSDAANAATADPAVAPESTEELAEEQALLAKLVHFLRAEDLNEQYKVRGLAHAPLPGESPVCVASVADGRTVQILVVTRKHFGEGGEQRIKYTLAPLVFAALRLVYGYYKNRSSDEMWDKKCQRIFQFCQQTVAVLAKAKCSDLALRLFLQCALAGSVVGFDNVCYEYVSHALVIYEEDLVESRAQFSAILLLIGTLEKIACLTEENFEMLTSKVYQHGSKLLRKPDQCSAIYNMTHIFWSGHTAEHGTEPVRRARAVSVGMLPHGLTERTATAARCEKGTGLSAEGPQNCRFMLGGGGQGAAVYRAAQQGPLLLRTEERVGPWRRAHGAPHARRSWASP